VAADADAVACEAATLLDSWLKDCLHGLAKRNQGAASINIKA
jgi:hypothetical protein